MSVMSAGRAVVNVLRAEGVKCVFGMPGGHVLGIYDALYDTPQIRHVLVRHEQVAAGLAAGYAQLTAEPGVVCVTAGPGATNLVTGIAEAYVGALPIVVIAGRGATTTAHRGASQEIAQDRLFAPITKWAVRVERADLIVPLLRKAFTVARSGKPGPVLVDIPRDVLAQEVEFAPYAPVGRPAPTRADPGSVRQAADALLAAKRPIVVAGGGTVASGAFDELRELAELAGLPVLTSLSGRGSLPDDHPLAAGGLGCHRNEVSARLLAQADFVLGLACRFEEMETNWRPGYLPAPDACYVQVDIDPVEIGRSVVPSIGVVGDVKLVLQDLCRLVRDAGGGSAPGRYLELPRVRALLRDKQRLESRAEEEAAPRRAGAVHPLHVMRALRALLPREATLALDVGVLAQHMGGAYPYLKVYEPRSMIVPSSFYSMGFASAALPCARLVYPDRPAVGLVGDGSFQMIMNVLPVAAEYRLPVTWCVLNDGALGSIRDIQEHANNGRYIATEFGVQPDFAKIAAACQCYGERVESDAQVGAALERAIDENRRGVPAVLDIAVAKVRTRATLEFAAPHYTAGSPGRSTAKART